MAVTSYTSCYHDTRYVLILFQTDHPELKQMILEAQHGLSLHNFVRPQGRASASVARLPFTLRLAPALAAKRFPASISTVPPVFSITPN